MPKFYPIYFPQFHSISENNISFYKDFTDIKNLKLLSNNLENTVIPLSTYCNIDNYDYVDNPQILEKQHKLIEDYNLSGFAIYYYWFSTNTITNNNEIFKNVINQLLNNKFNKKHFFIWANENWTSNPAFGTSTHKIENNYDDNNNLQFCNNIIKYFKHENYLKIKNKPVFYIHHPWFIKKNKLEKLIQQLNFTCITNHFDGILIRFNSIGGKISDKFKYYNHEPNYKNPNNISKHYVNNKIYNGINYDTYVNNTNMKTNSVDVEVLYFDFDNRARLFKPDRLNLSTICYNNSISKSEQKLKGILNYYHDREEEDDIILINAFNEWGEKMTLEPDNISGYSKLDMIKKYIIKQ